MGTTNRRAIQLQNRYHKQNLHYKPAEIRKAFHELDKSGLFNVPNGEISIVFLTDNEIARLHDQFLDDPEPTDVITFPGDPEMDFAGEICVSVDQAARVAAERNEPFSKELVLYLVHGYLHLAGFRDTTASEKREMRKAEKNALSLLENLNRLPTFSLKADDFKNAGR